MSAPVKRVLLVDDDEGILSSLQCALEHRGYAVIVARDGAEALARIERDTPDLVVLDVVMPRRSGLMVLDRLHRSHRGAPPVILLTGNDEARHREFAASRGVAAFLAKPFEMNELLSAVDTQLRV